MKRKKILSIFFILAIVFSMKTMQVLAAEDSIPSIDIEVSLNKDGSAVITEIWEVKGVSSGTEYYKALYNLEEMSVSSFQVWDESGTKYKTQNEWNTKLTREEKAGTCGILSTSKGYELCWGIGEYGDHTYTIQYTLDGLVKNYGEYAGFYHQFVSELSSAPEAVSIKIGMSDSLLNESSARIWGYGFGGDVSIKGDGTLLATTSKELESEGYVNLLCRFSTDLFPSVSAGNMTFEELQELAEDEESSDMWLLFFIVVPVIVGILLLLVFSGVYRLSDGTKVRLKKKNIDSTPSIPFHASLPAVYYTLQLLRKYTSYNELLGAYLIRWQKEGYISIEERGVEQKDKKGKKKEAILFHNEVPSEREVERKLYDILIQLADKNHLLWAHRLEKNADKLEEKLSKWEKLVRKKGRDELLQMGVIEKGNKKEFRFTPYGFEQAVGLLGLEKYLKELTQNAKSPEKELWGEYLVFAQIFKIGEEVVKVMEKTDPIYFNTFAGYYGLNSYSMMHFMYMTNHMSSKISLNTNGMGGSASSIGGGGFSGGGGGGSR